MSATLEPIPVASPAFFHRMQLRLRDRLPTWVVYRPCTREYPGRWVARMHVTLPASRPTRFVMTHDSRDGLRQMLPPGLINLGREEQDVQEIEEVWV